MKKSFLLFPALLVFITSCQNNQNDSNQNDSKYKEISQEAIAVHDEIMPQVSVFDKTGLRVDSLLSNMSHVLEEHPEVDTAMLSLELGHLKSDLEKATSDMMTWMREYNLDSADVNYQEQELNKISELRDFYKSVTDKKEELLNNL